MVLNISTRLRVDQRDPHHTLFRIFSRALDFKAQRRQLLAKLAEEANQTFER